MALPGLGRCTYALWLAVVLDVVGLAALLVGIFADLQRAGRDYGDMLIYTGAIVVFLSLIGWVFWYTGNIEISAAELARDYRPKASRLHRIVRRISRSISMSSGSKPAGGLGTGQLRVRVDGAQPKELDNKEEETHGQSAMD